MTRRKNQKALLKNGNDQVEWHARTIWFEAKIRDSLNVMTGDFECHEIGEGPDLGDLGDPEVRVEMDAGISASQATRALSKVIAHIEAHGIPKTMTIETRETVRELEECQDATHKLNESMARLPADLCDLVVEYFRNRSNAASGQGVDHD